ncbi:peptidase M19 [Nitratireductor mangrovi]|uniref:Peptidase M19 n=1 Tax=Nitratireductor mangrovi TaxID=2599600 RepID=A0A5B8KXL3_9HYPH|nr:dipeptidase [Nitratireductor mangrovi]QDZ00302.1 peptidase M19 [Nitratireductor mangrovi]
MSRFIRAALVILVLLVVAGLGIFFFVAPQMVERSMNPVGASPPYEVSDEARRLHETLTVADLHADSLLWGRDLVEKGDRGHVDIPRLIEGNVAVQMFTLVSKTPQGLNIERNDDTTDNVFWLAVGQRWPLRTWFSLKERALYQAERLHDMAARSDGRFVIVKSKADLAAFLERRRSEPGIVAGVLGIEGAQVLEGDPANVDVMFEAGYRMMSPTHFFDNAMAGSAHGIEKGGLTEAGREMIRRMEAVGMIVDISHGSVPQIDDVLVMAKRPVVVSHTGVRGTCDNNRNLSDDQLRAIAANGGLVGVGFWQTAICGNDAAAIARAQRYVADLIGAEHVGLGSDFDGAVGVPFDASGTGLLTEALLAEGMAEPDIARVMGGNQIRLLLELLPD